jgi:sugar phosphate isomerase/epimerase
MLFCLFRRRTAMKKMPPPPPHFRLERRPTNRLTGASVYLNLRMTVMRKLACFTLTLLACASLPGQDVPKAAAAADQLGWQMAIHAYTFRKFSIFECIDKTAALGLKHMSLSGSVSLDGKSGRKTVTLSDAAAAAIRKAAAAKGIKLINIGVVQLPPDEAESRGVFEFAKRMGIDTLVAEPEPAALDVVEKLCKEYAIKVAIHNHPKPSRYWNPDTVLEAIKGRSPLLGACADTGHWLRSGLDPRECLKKLEGHVICLHFKDLVPEEPKTAAAAEAGKKKEGAAKAMHDVPWGTGVGQVKAQMAELKRQGFRGAFCVEYEYNWDNSMPEIAECKKFFDATCAELAGKP